MCAPSAPSRKYRGLVFSLHSTMHVIMSQSACADFKPVQNNTEVQRVRRRKYKRYTKGTYIGLLAYVIQDSPNKMLTFRQIMEKLGVFVSGDRKGLENNIRVCLSSNKCFVKVPIDPDFPNAKRNFWKMDESCITPKMLRRHFSDITAMLPGFNPQWQEKCEDGSELEPSSLASSSKENNQPVKFSSPFSIESLLKNDHSALRTPSVQDRGGLWDYGLTPTASSFYKFTHTYYTYNSEVAGLSGTPAVRKDLCPSQLSYDQTALNKLWSTSLFSHDLRYLRW